MLEKADEWVLRKHQELVDWSQRQPRWWLEQAGYVVAGLAVVRAGVALPHSSRLAFAILCDLFFAAFAVLCARHPAIPTPFFRSPGMRGLVLVTILWAVLLEATKAVPPSFLNVCRDVAWVTLIYFPLCKPPRSNEEKRKVDIAARH